jgi:predicted GNAT family acetyltransferase
MKTYCPHFNQTQSLVAFETPRALRGKGQAQDVVAAAILKKARRHFLITP